TAPCTSVTMRTMWNVPGCVKMCVGFSSLLLEPSPKSQADLKLSPSGSVDLLVKVTVSGAGPLLGVVRKSAIGGRFSRVVLVVEDGRVEVVVVVTGGPPFTLSIFGLATPPRESVTTRVMVNVPACLNTCVGLSSELFDPSPKSHSEVNESPSGSVDLFVKDTVRGAGPLLGGGPNAATPVPVSRGVLSVESARLEVLVVV